MRQVVIVGGGLAGLTLGILLRRARVPVQIWEASSYPRHRVCGEFVSGVGARLLEQLAPALASRARRSETVRFFTDGQSSPALTLPASGLSISRWDLDGFLAALFQNEGGELLSNQRWTGAFSTEGIVRAAGRRPVHRGSRWSGVKAHVRNLEPDADLEMHFSDRGYLGISRLPIGTNLCALVDDQFDLGQFRSNPRETFQRLTDRDLSRVEFEPCSICAVSGVSFDHSRNPNECGIGDAIRMIPPFTGNGMSLAIESAFLAAPELIAYSDGQHSWAETRARVNQTCTRCFRRRFAGANFFRRVAGRSWTRRLMLSTLRTVPRVLRVCFSVTR
jgi:menaquinone-9 beta-reductase